jgi:hypothetical protein
LDPPPAAPRGPGDCDVDAGAAAGAEEEEADDEQAAVNPSTAAISPATIHRRARLVFWWFAFMVTLLWVLTRPSLPRVLRRYLQVVWEAAVSALGYQTSE